MNLLKCIKIKNVKGKDSMEFTFSDLCANLPNIIVAPNGYGKSTIATAFKAASNGKMKLDSKDYFQKSEENHPELEVELCGENEGVYKSTDTVGNISKNIYIYTINSPVYAKSTTKGMGRSIKPTADLRVESIVIFDKIPEKKQFDYSSKMIKDKYGDKSKLFVNISSMLGNADNTEMLLNIQDCIKKCISQVGINDIFNSFIDKCNGTGTAQKIKSNIQQEEIDKCYANSKIAELLQCIDGLKDKPQGWIEIDSIFVAIQICLLIKKHIDMGESDIIKKVNSYLNYKQSRELIDERLNLFNTTGRTVKTKECKGKLVIDFERASSMSNGERDILSFVAHLACFEIGFKKKIGIFIIDEVFDYLDGSNMLAVQYYLSEMINRCKEAGKVLFPIIFTHLDPAVFSNYYFNKKKVHYISSTGNISLDSDIVKMLRVREKRDLPENEKEEIEKYYIHYIEDIHMMSPSVISKISTTFNKNNLEFRQQVYVEITDKYLNGKAYNPVMVIAGVRIRIEELVYSRLEIGDREEYICQHKVINKLNYADLKGIELSELFYVLQPLYNDGLHLGGNEEEVKRKIKSCYLKIDNMHIRRMIGMLFE